MDFNSVTPGDWLLGLTAIASVALSVWAMLVSAALLFRRKAERAQYFYETSPVRSFITGILLGGGGYLVAVILLGNGLPILKLLGWVIAAIVTTGSLIGGAGLVLLVGNRVAGMENKPNSFGTLARGAGLIVVAGLVPLFGWFAYVPVVILLSFGTGLRALVYKPESQYAPAPLAQSGEAIQ
jgi:hypothetical protein